MNVATSLLLNMFKSSDYQRENPYSKEGKKEDRRAQNSEYETMFKLTQSQHWALTGIYHPDILGKI